MRIKDVRNIIKHMVGPLAKRVRMSIAKAVIDSVTDSADIQSLKVQILADEVIGSIERMQEYGFSSVPFNGTEAVAVFAGGNRANGVIIATDDRRHRPKGSEGDTFIYNAAGAIIKLDNATGDIELTAPSGFKINASDIFLGDELTGESAVKGESLKSWLDTHTHVGSAPGSPTSPPSIPLPTTALSTITKVE